MDKEFSLRLEEGNIKVEKLIITDECPYTLHSHSCFYGIDLI
jgi:hypothetical protein